MSGLTNSHGMNSQEVERVSSSIEKPLNIAAPLEVKKKGGPWSKYNEAERIALSRIRHEARGSLMRALRVWINGLEDDDKWYRHRCAAELCNRFGLPTMTEQRHQVQGTQVQVMVFPFPNPFPPAPVEVEAVDVVDEAPDPSPQQGEGRETAA